MSAFTVAFTGSSSVLRADFFPEISLDPNRDYCCGLLDFTTYNSIPNIIDNQNNQFKFKYNIDEKKKSPQGKETTISVTREKTISLPTGSYEVEDILKYLKSQLAAEHINLTYEISAVLLKVKIAFNTQITWTGGSVLNILGFHKETLSTFKKNAENWSAAIARITPIDLIRVECDIVSGSYINGKNCHTIHQFSHCKVSPGYKFIEVPRHIVYLPIKEKQIRSIQISIVDQNGNPINFRGEQISCRIHIKQADN